MLLSVEALKANRQFARFISPAMVTLKMELSNPNWKSTKWCNSLKLVVSAKKKKKIKAEKRDVKGSYEDLTEKWFQVKSQRWKKS